MDRTTYIQLTPEQYQSHLQNAARLVAKEVVARNGRIVRQALMMSQGIADKKMLAEIYDVSVSTVERWAKRHGFEKIDGPNRRRAYYCMQDVAEKVRDTGKSED